MEAGARSRPSTRTTRGDALIYKGQEARIAVLIADPFLFDQGQLLEFVLATEIKIPDRVGPPLFLNDLEISPERTLFEPVRARVFSRSACPERTC